MSEALTDFKKIIRESKLAHVVIKYYHPCDDPIDGYMEGSEKVEKLTKRTLYMTCKDALANAKRYGETPKPPQTIEDCIKLFEAEWESEWGFAKVIARKSHKKEQAERQFRRMQDAAASFASKYKVKPGTLEFLKALRKAVRQVKSRRDSWNDGETRAEQWAAHMYGGSSEAYFDDLNYENGRFSEQLTGLRELWDYCEGAFPLLMVRYRERLLHKKKGV